MDTFHLSTLLKMLLAENQRNFRTLWMEFLNKNHNVAKTCLQMASWLASQETEERLEVAFEQERKRNDNQNKRVEIERHLDICNICNTRPRDAF